MAGQPVQLAFRKLYERADLLVERLRASGDPDVREVAELLLALISSLYKGKPK